MQNNFLGYPDPRPHRTFANIRYALYEYWLRHYSDNSYILILDFRDTFFQANPFGQYGAYSQRTEPKYDLQMYAENYKVSYRLLAWRGLAWPGPGELALPLSVFLRSKLIPFIFLSFFHYFCR